MSPVIPVGPYHPALEEPYKIELVCDGEAVHEAHIPVGFNLRAIEWLAEDFEHRTGITCETRVQGDDVLADHDRATAVYRIVQETLTNVARHAGATRVEIVMDIHEKTLRLSVRDNGKGVTDEQIRAPGSFGIMGIKERALIFGGEVSIGSSGERGTTVSLTLPLDGSREPSGAGTIAHHST